jgi:hypothetical protein
MPQVGKLLSEKEEKLSTLYVDILLQSKWHVTE